METSHKTTIALENVVNALAEKASECRTGTRHITQWNNASESWHTPDAENDMGLVENSCQEVY